MYQKNMFDRYYCMKLFCFLEISKNASKIQIFCITHVGTHRHEGLKNASSGAKTYIILTWLNYVHFYAHLQLLLMTSIFVTAPDIVYINKKAVH